MWIFSFRSSPIQSRHSLPVYPRGYCPQSRGRSCPVRDGVLRHRPYRACRDHSTSRHWKDTGTYGFAAVLGGALSHLAIDVLACPGIPLLAPFVDRKYTLGILPGPSILLAGAALGLVAVTIAQVLAFPQALTFYALTVLLYLTVRVGSFLFAFIRLTGTERYRPLTRSGGWQSPRMRHTSLHGRTPCSTASPVNRCLPSIPIPALPK